MAKYRKKPVVIEAVKAKHVIDSTPGSWPKLPNWVKEGYAAGTIVFGANCLFIQTREGKMKAKYSDWLICGVEGEIYPCAASVFSATYEAVHDELPDPRQMDIEDFTKQAVAS